MNGRQRLTFSYSARKGGRSLIDVSASRCRCEARVVDTRAPLTFFKSEIFSDGLGSEPAFEV